MSFQTFTRTWWKHNAKWPGGREPGAGPKTYHEEYETEQEARTACQEWNASHDPGPLSNKMEYEEI